MLMCKKVPAFDGVNLAADVFLPDGQARFLALLPGRLILALAVEVRRSSL